MLNEETKPPAPAREPEAETTTAQAPPGYVVWDCKLVLPPGTELPRGFDAVPRSAAERAVLEALGMDMTVATFSGWAGCVSAIEHCTIEDMTFDETDAYLKQAGAPPTTAEAYAAAYRQGYGNGHHDATTGETELGDDPGDSYEIWLVERSGGMHPSDDAAPAGTIGTIEVHVMSCARLRNDQVPCDCGTEGRSNA